MLAPAGRVLPPAAAAQSLRVVTGVIDARNAADQGTTTDQFELFVPRDGLAAAAVEAPSARGGGPPPPNLLPGILGSVIGSYRGSVSLQNSAIIGVPLTLL